MNDGSPNGFMPVCPGLDKLNHPLLTLDRSRHPRPHPVFPPWSPDSGQIGGYSTTAQRKGETMVNVIY